MSKDLLVKPKYKIDLDEGDEALIKEGKIKWIRVRSLHHRGSNSKAHNVGDHYYNCALCLKYNYLDGADVLDCEGCPLYEAFGETCSSEDSPFGLWKSSYNENGAKTSDNMVKTFDYLLNQ